MSFTYTVLRALHVFSVEDALPFRLKFCWLYGDFDSANMKEVVNAAVTKIERRRRRPRYFVTRGSNIPGPSAPRHLLWDEHDKSYVDLPWPAPGSLPAPVPLPPGSF